MDDGWFRVRKRDGKMAALKKKKGMTKGRKSKGGEYQRQKRGHVRVMQVEVG